MIQSAINAVNSSKTAAKAAVAKSAPEQAPATPAVASHVAIPTKNPGHADDKVRAKTQPDLTQAQINEAVRKWKLKVNGADREIAEPDMVRLAQMGLSANEKWEQSSKMKREADSIMAEFKNPGTLRESLKKIGYSDQQIQELAHSVIANQISDQLLSPEEKQMRDREARMAEKERRIEEEAQQKKQAELTKMTDYWRNQYDVQMTDALKKSRLPADPYLVKKMAAMMEDAIINKIPATWDDIVAVLKPELFSHHSQMLDAYESDVLGEALGEKITKKLRDADLKRLKDPKKPSAPQINKSKKPPMFKKEKTPDWSEKWQAHKDKIDRIKKGLE